MTVELLQTTYQEGVALDERYDVVIADPPYDEPPDMALLRAVSRGNILVFCAPEKQFFVPDEFLFWIKTPSTKNYVKHVGRFVEIILVERHGDTFNQLHWSQMTGAYDDRHVLPVEHPFQKPKTLIERILRIYAKPGDHVLDPYAGSGIVGVVAQEMGMSYTGFEDDPANFKLAQKNIFERKGLL